MPFVKLDCGIIHSSLWAQDSDTKICWITLLLLADARGFVRAAASAVAREAGISDEAARCALELFSASDDESRSPENEGRRIEKIEGGYRVLNYGKYRDHDYTATERQRRHRAMLRRDNRDKPLLSRKQKQSTEADKEKPPYPLKRGNDGFDLFWSAYPNKQAKPVAKRAWLKIDPTEREEVMRGLTGWKQSEAWSKDNGSYIPYPATFLNQRRWEDPPRTKAPKPRVVYGVELPPRREPTPEEFKRVGAIANREVEKLRSTLGGRPK